MRPRSSSLTRLGRLLCAAAFSWPSQLHAQPGTGELGTLAEPSAVLVVEVGQAGDWRELERVLREFLLPHRLVPAFEWRATLTRLDALGESPRAVPKVFVELVSAERARLVLSDERRGRYLLRDVPLPNGLDEIGRETLAQVIESSLVALQGQTSALSRDELDRLLTSEAAFAPTPTAPTPMTDTSEAVRLDEAPPSRTAPPPAKATPEPALTSLGRTRLQLAGAYAVQWSGPEFGLLHGPALRLEWARALQSGHSWFAATTGELRFKQRYESRLVDVDVTSRAAWLTGGVKQTWGGELRLGAGAGLGVEWSVIGPRDVAGGLSRVLPETSDTTVWLRAELGLERRFGAFHLALWLLGDFCAQDTHYDVRRGGRAERLVTPWRARPGLRLAFGWGS